MLQHDYTRPCMTRLTIVTHQGSSMAISVNQTVLLSNVWDNTGWLLWLHAHAHTLQQLGGKLWHQILQAFTSRIMHTHNTHIWLHYFHNFRWGLLQFSKGQPQKNPTFSFSRWTTYQALFDIFNAEKVYHLYNYCRFFVLILTLIIKGQLMKQIEYYQYLDF